MSNPELRSVIESLFLDRQWSPEQIIPRLNHEGVWMPVSITTIYRTISFTTVYLIVRFLATAKGL
ncbi:hypothetical protein CMALT430_70074 [Carnobacterium maltaromaticum]|nr:hypothetical protein CMALT430_70074 [Carnobacterium maltaromaticum]